LIKNDDASTGYCASCPEGERSEPFASACNADACPAGTYTDREACVACPQGFYQDQGGQQECPYCPSGYVKAANSQSCEEGCEIGSYTLSGTTGCGLCPDGEYQDQTKQSNCKDCDRGYFLSDNSKNITPFTTARHDDKNDCFLCAAGMFSDAGFQFCIMCPNGWSANYYGMSAQIRRASLCESFKMSFIRLAHIKGKKMFGWYLCVLLPIILCVCCCGTFKKVGHGSNFFFYSFFLLNSWHTKFTIHCSGYTTGIKASIGWSCSGWWWWWWSWQ
jgi:hypothetical protein